MAAGPTSGSTPLFRSINVSMVPIEVERENRKTYSIIHSLPTAVATAASWNGQGSQRAFLEIDVGSTYRTRLSCEFAIHV